MKIWKQSLKEYVEEQSEDGRIVVDSLARKFMLTHRAELEEDAEAHMLRRVIAETQSMLHGGSMQSQKQLYFEGMEFPAFIAVRLAGSNETYHVRSENATWTELMAGLEERQNNVGAAQAKVDSYLLSMDMVRHLMETAPAMTLAEALRILANSEGAI